MAQLGDLVRRRLSFEGLRAFGAKETVARARCVVAEAEIALVSRDLSWPRRHCKRRARRSKNTATVSMPPMRGTSLSGVSSSSGASTRPSARLASTPRPPSRAEDRVRSGGRGDRDSTFADEGGTRHSLAPGALRSTRVSCADSGGRKRFNVLNTPSARLIADGEERLLVLGEVEALLKSNAFVVDACRHVVRYQLKVVSLARRPVLFAVARAGRSVAARRIEDALVARAFGAKLARESHRAVASRSRAASAFAANGGRHQRDKARIC